MAGITPPATSGDSDMDGEDFEVWEENWESVCWFLQMDRRWVFNMYSGQRVRLDDQAVMVHLKLHISKKPERRKIMEDLLIMEQAALEVFNG